MVEDARRALREGRCSVPAVGSVVAGPAADLPFVVADSDGQAVEPVSAYLRDLMLGDASPLTCRSYAFDLLRWHRLLWMLETPWEKATEAEVAVLVGWLRQAPNPQHRRRRADASPPGSVNLKTGKPSLRAGYAPRTINHALAVIGGFYSFHARFGAGPVLNPIPVSAERRRALAHRSPLEPVPVFRRARLRQKVPVQAPRAIPDHRWEELFAAMGCDRDRALLEFYVSSGARAGELLGVGLDDVDWAGQRIYVISKGTRVRQAVPASPDAFRYLGAYLAADGLPAVGQPVWRTRRGESRPLTYWAMRRILQRANDKLGTNWTLLSRPGARCRDCSRPVSPSRSPNPPCRSLGNGLSTVSAVRRGWGKATGTGSWRPGRSTGRPSLLGAGSTRPHQPRSPTARKRS
ncbi:tyrosine-type recombinase/integrase [Frankia sp. Cj3]|uniref:tyrosine-type recombinase/integrase n=1 Tax=Frankia sp. Cj3 TaxID=2880976 RepID=UPI00351D1939